MIEIKNTSNYMNSVKKFNLSFRQWYKTRIVLFGGVIVIWSVVFWLLSDFLTNGEVYDTILLIILMGCGLLIIYELLVPLISYRKSIKLLKQRFSLNNSYEVIYTLNKDSFVFPELEGSKNKYTTSRYESLRSITFSAKENAILFRKNLRLETIVVLLDDLNDMEKEQVLTLIPSLKFK
ncbi:hypothetical protein [Liberiplasma polymorphum]|uniref:hypothetical protein n=1 Tax=Liberiplasma polymorphum TaxID=3374570 RepID=UPI003773229A